MKVESREESNRTPELGENILPEDLSGWSVAQIEEQLAKHLGIPPPALDGHIAARAEVEPGERVARRIQEDAEALHRLGVGRSKLAEVLDRVIEIERCRELELAHALGAVDAVEGKGGSARQTKDEREEAARIRGCVESTRRRIAQALNLALGEDGDFIDCPFTVEIATVAKGEKNPFHPSGLAEPLFSGDVGGSGQVTITNERVGLTLELSDMLPYLIRAACFFPGGKDRPRPEQLCRLLGLC